MIDSYQREIDYMRVSITDRCNLRCTYCMPRDLPLLPHEEILRYEEILRISGAAARLGVRHIKVTGGEPLVRRGAVGLIAALKKLPGIEHVTMTTNGVLLEEHLPALKEIGLDGLNISLDALDPEMYRQITGRDEFHRAWSALEKALAMGFPVKVNCVPLAGYNDGALLPLALLAREHRLDIRFIEMMPIGYGRLFRAVPGDEILALLKGEIPGLREDAGKRGFGPARYYSAQGLKGTVGFIDAMSHNFCQGCNRIRLTSEGFLKLCLYHGGGVDLRTPLRQGIDDDGLCGLMRAAVQEKPERHQFGSAEGADRKRMSQIGG